jgi:hypothetical protein
MKSDTDLSADYSDPFLDFDFANDDHDEDESKAAEMLLALKHLFDDHRVSTRSQLNEATRMFCALEGLHILRSSDAYDEITRLRQVWKYRLVAQDDIDRWMIEHGHPLY